MGRVLCFDNVDDGHACVVMCLVLSLVSLLHLCCLVLHMCGCVPALWTCSGSVDVFRLCGCVPAVWVCSGSVNIFQQCDCLVPCHEYHVYDEMCSLSF